MVRWVFEPIPYGEPIELFLGPTSAPQLVYIKITCCKLERVAYEVVAVDFLSHYLHGSLLCVICNIIVNIVCVECVIKNISFLPFASIPL